MFPSYVQPVIVIIFIETSFPKTLNQRSDGDQKVKSYGGTERIDRPSFLQGLQLNFEEAAADSPTITAWPRLISRFSANYSVAHETTRPGSD